MSKESPKNDVENSQISALLEIINGIARNSRTDNLTPCPDKKIGRECYAFSEIEDKVIAYLKNQISNLLTDLPSGQYKIEEDAIGNLITTLKGKNPNGKKVVIGSHVDSVTNGGMYDGVLGVAAGFNLLKYLIDNHIEIKDDFVLAAFRGEESSPKTGRACLGSAVAFGTISKEELEKINYKTKEGKKIPLKDFFGPKKWENILKETAKPPFTKGNTILFEEMHIEQSRTIDLQNADLGIVAKGIGGNRRSEFKTPAEQLSISEIDPKKHQEFQISITGQKDHTGGTPMNHSPNFVQDELYWRKDAIVAGSYFIFNLLAEAAKDNIPVKINGIEVKEKSAFTTIPNNLDLQIAFPQDFSQDQIQKLLQRVSNETSTKKGVKIRIEPVKIGSHLFLDNEEVKTYLNKIFEIECAAREINNQREVDTVRATVTDLVFTPEKGVSFLIDQREVDHKDANSLNIIIQDTLNKIGALDIIAEEKSAQMDAEITTISQRIATEMGIKFITLPSVPGQDAKNPAKLDIPTGMIMVRHNGISHNEAEYVEAKHIIKPYELMLKLVLEKLC